MSETNRTAKATEVDVVVLGVGTCGEDLSLQLLDAGLKVVGIEAALVGGECAYWACIPTKMMIRAANVLQEARRVNDLAGQADITPDWTKVAQRVRESTGGWNDSNAISRFEQRGGRLIKGRGKITGERTVIVGDESFTARRGIVIATGSSPVIPPVPGLSDIDYWTTHEVIQAEKLPKSIVVMGGGAVGCELGQVLARFGVDVTIVQAGNHLLAAEDQEIAEILEKSFEKEGIKVYTGETVQQVKSSNGQIITTLSGGTELQSERLLVATGRRANIKNLGLETIGIDSNARYIDVDERLRVRGGVWAMGDVTGKAMFTHLALYQSTIIAADILGQEHPPARYNAVPRATFTDPQVATVGITESDARAADMDVVVDVKQLAATFRGWIHGTGDGLIKLIADRKSGILLGASVAGPQAGEMLGMLTLAIHSAVPAATLRSMIYAFPTFYGGIGEAVKAYGGGVTTVLDPAYEDVIGT